MGKQSVPTLKEMMNEKMVVPLFILFIVSAIMVFFALAFESLHSLYDRAVCSIHRFYHDGNKYFKRN